jgi:hypothetical protein
MMDFRALTAAFFAAQRGGLILSDGQQDDLDAQRLHLIVRYPITTSSLLYRPVAAQAAPMDEGSPANRDVAHQSCILSVRICEQDATVTMLAFPIAPDI